jgi:hypothetical protein
VPDCRAYILGIDGHRFVWVEDPITQIVPPPARRERGFAAPGSGIGAWGAAQTKRETIPIVGQAQRLSEGWLDLSSRTTIIVPANHEVSECDGPPRAVQSLFRILISGHLDFFPNHTGAISRRKMAAPVRADIRMSTLERPKTKCATTQAVTAATTATQRAARMSMVRSSIPNPPRVNFALLSGTGDPILVISRL